MTGFIPAPIKPEITMDHLEKVDIRTGMVKRVELVRTSNKLVRLTVDFGDRRRTVLAGLRGERADPKAEIEGCQALFVAKPAGPIGDKGQHVSGGIGAIDRHGDIVGATALAQLDQHCKIELVVRQVEAPP